MRAFVLLLLVAAPFAALAQPGTMPAPPPPPPPVGSPDTAPVGAPTRGRDAYALAVQQLAAGQTAEATALLERLAADDPASLPVALTLQQAYERAGRTDDALRLVETRLGGETPAGLAERGAVLLRANRPDDATAAFERALALGPADEGTLRAVSDALSTSRRYAEAAAVLERGREALGQPDAFRFERAALYAEAQDYGRAADLYLDALAERPEATAGVRARLRRMLPGTGAPEALRAAVDRAQTRDPLNRAYRELASFLALERGDFDAALDGIRALDRLDREDGQSLLAFAQAAEAAGALDAARRALDEILTRHPDGPVAPDALVARAGLLERQSRAAAERAPDPTPLADAARADLTAFRERSPGHLAAPQAALTLARLTRDVYLDYPASEALLAEAADGPNTDVAAEARLDLGDIAVRAGRLDEARERFGAVDETLGTGRLAEQARFELALLDFYEGYVFSALARVEAIDENTAADATNDAIALRATLNENAEEPGSADSTNASLKAYAAASLLVRQGRDARALAALDSLGAAVADGPLADEILFLSARAQRRLGRPADAVATLDRLAEETPLSFFCDRALVVQADIAEHDLADRPAAMARLATLLDRYPGSLFAPDARERLRALRAAS
ncbi:MAG TPA: tetratricopeptide repeat protein [Rubricoccaceae bacterium]